MAKYNLTEPKEKKATYSSLVNPVLMDELRDKILKVMTVQEKYKDKEYSARRLAEDLGTNTRYISAVVSVRFQMNYTSFVNKFRVEEAKKILSNKDYSDLSMEDVGDMVGFANRQSFYGAFYRFMRMTPRAYRMQHYGQHPDGKPLKRNKKAENTQDNKDV